MSEVLVRVAYTGIDHAGRHTVMVSHDYHDLDRLGWQMSVTQ